MKRFTETGKWEDSWFRKLPGEMKLLWQWLLDKCDNAGVIDADLELASFHIGYAYPMDTLSQFGDRLVLLKCGKYFIPKFIEFQYGTLSEDCKAHNPIFQSLKKHGLKGYAKGMDTLQEKEKEKDKEKNKEESVRETKAKASTPEEVIEYCRTIGLPDSDGSACFDKWVGNGWKNGGTTIKDWKATIRSWKTSGYLPSQKAKGQPTTATTGGKYDSAW